MESHMIPREFGKESLVGKTFFLRFVDNYICTTHYPLIEQSLFNDRAHIESDESDSDDADEQEFWLTRFEICFNFT